MITDGKMQKLSPLFIGITSKNKEDLYCSNCLHSYRTENVKKAL